MRAAARSRSSPRSTASAPAPARSSRWRATSASARRTPRSRSCSTASGSPGCDMGACAILPRIIGQGRASELLYTGRVLGGEEAERWGFFNAPLSPASAARRGDGARRATRRWPDLRQRDDQAHARHGMGDVDRAAIEAEAVAQALCMETEDFAPRLSRLRRQAEAGVRGQLMMISSPTTLSWPFFEERHRRFADELCALGRERRCPRSPTMTMSTPPAARSWRRSASRAPASGRAGGLRRAAPELDVRTLVPCARDPGVRDGLADFAFAMQGLGTGPISLFGSAELKPRYLPGVRHGRAHRGLRAVRARGRLRCRRDGARTATPDGNSTSLDGDKTWISNGGIADFYCVFARTEPAQVRADGSIAARGISAFVVDADTPGLSIAERIDVIAPHPLAQLRFDACRISATQRLGAAGRGLQDRDANARHVPYDRGGRGPRLRPARTRRSIAVCAASRHVRPQRSPTSS